RWYRRAALVMWAKGLAFLETTLTAPANEPFKIEFDNQDDAIPHNVEIHDHHINERHLHHNNHGKHINTLHLISIVLKIVAKRNDPDRWQRTLFS
ncbi:MAG: hypothetical protein WD941_04190, partial [Opitutus sp.]